jgi:aspartate/methionine/tyrosine aminotransferase
MGGAPLPARPRAGPRPRGPGAQWIARGAVPRRAGGEAPCRKPRRPPGLIPNPFYAAYAAGAVAADCEIVYLPATRQTGFLPDLDALEGALLARTVAMFLASPSNPQGAVADMAYLQRVTAMARRYGFLLFCDECYSEIYTRSAPPGVLAAAGDQFENVVLFQSLSKRSNLPGLRIGFVLGDRRFMAKFLELRNVAAPQVPIPAQQVAVAAISTGGNSISPTRSSATGTAIAGRPEASFSGST